MIWYQLLNIFLLGYPGIIFNEASLGEFPAALRQHYSCPAHSSIFRTRNRCLSLAAEMVGRSKAEWRTVSVERMKQSDSKSAPMKHWSSKTNSDNQSLAWGVLGAGLFGLIPPLTLIVASVAKPLLLSFFFNKPRETMTEPAWALWLMTLGVSCRLHSLTCLPSYHSQSNWMAIQSKANHWNGLQK